MPSDPDAGYWQAMMDLADDQPADTDAADDDTGSVVDIEAVRIELRQWQMDGLAGRHRTEAQRDRVAALWRQIDEDHRRSMKREGGDR
ncbi:hypothetical protein [Bradyrhizobium sp. HKCCYLRH3061]|uniref:hypothetical protein n=1 Tax=Bradyrhizobium sp. HKCCYLRH3061 TaxID=3420734 RepID=UPI003EB985DD